MAQIVGTQGADTLIGTAESDSIYAYGGDDTIDGRGGADYIDAGAGNDRILLTTGSNATAVGGTGRDTFVLSGSGSGLSTISDFTPGAAGDVIDLSSLYGAGDGFANGYFRIIQSGVDTLVQFDSDGLYSGRYSFGWVSVLKLSNTQASQFTAENFMGFDPQQDPNAAITGTDAADTLIGGAGNNVIRGLSGNDIIDGRAGNDTIDGGSGDDVIEGGAGNDVIDGGDGDDTLTDSGSDGSGTNGFDTLRGGGGNDRITAIRSASYERLVIDGGSGRDTVRFAGAQATIDLGADDDSLTLYYYNSGTAQVTLGSGRDTIVIDPSYTGAGYYNYASRATVSDFVAGAGGDIISTGALLRSTTTTWDGRNPFASGHLQLQQSGNDVTVVFDPDGTGGSRSPGTLLTLQNVQLAQLTAANFDGYAPDGSPTPGTTRFGTSGTDVITGGEGGDTIFGYAGDDTLSGDAGDDLIDGGEGNDVLDGGYGNDHLYGGVGDDRLTDMRTGSDVIDGGDGNDTIELFHANSSSEQVSITAGNGNDTVRVGSYAAGTLFIDLGEGDDTLTLAQTAFPLTDVSLVLGAGQDRVSLTGSSPGSITIADFQAGVGGDVLDLSQIVARAVQGGQAGAGYVRLVQAENNVLVQLDPDGAANGTRFTTYALLQNVIASQVTTANLAGFTPTVVSMAEVATVRISAPTTVIEGVGNNVTPLLALRNVTTATTNVNVSIVADQSTATNGVDFSMASYSGTVTVNQSTPGDFFFALPTIAYNDDAEVEGAETITFRVTASGQTFANGTDTTLVTIRLAERAQSGTPSADRITGTRFDDVLTGGDGNDVLLGSAGADIIDGGAGRDTLVYETAFGRGLHVGDDALTVTKPGGATDQITGVERIDFVDGSFIVDANSLGAQVSRMYDTVLSRAPDGFGLDFWVDRMEDGLSLGGVAGALAGSSEFQQATGGLSNMAFVDYVYTHALGRGPDADGRAFWTGQLDAGLTRDTLLVEFSEGAEHRGRTATLVAQGYFQTDDDAQAIALLYDSFAGRRPDADGLAFWTGQVKSGAYTLEQVAGAFAGSGEFAGATAGKSNVQVVEFMYNNTLDRAPDARGLAYWTTQLDAGLSRGNLLLEFSQSAEHHNLLANQITGGIDLIM